jgi:ABC-2 type transport system ATP-binding protein
MADTGSVEMNGKALSKAHLHQIGYLPEERGLYKKQKVWAQLLYFAELRGLTRREAVNKAEYWLKKMALWEIRQKPLEELSKGMQQKIQVIVACLHDPELLILDEPISGFDPVNAELLSNILLELKQAGTSIIFSTHRMESVEQLCDYMAIIHESKLVLNGKIDDIKAQYANGKVIVTCDQTIQLDPNAYAITKHCVNSKGQNEYTIQIVSGNNNALISEVIKQAQLLSFTPVTPSILDIFIQLVTSNNNA